MIPSPNATDARNRGSAWTARTMAAVKQLEQAAKLKVKAV